MDKITRLSTIETVANALYHRRPEGTFVLRANGSGFFTTSLITPATSATIFTSWGERLEQAASSFLGSGKRMRLTFADGTTKVVDGVLTAEAE